MSGVPLLRTDDNARTGDIDTAHHRPLAPLAVLATTGRHGQLTSQSCSGELARHDARMSLTEPPNEDQLHLLETIYAGRR
jgi:hypothetical protein